MRVGEKKVAIRPSFGRDLALRWGIMWRLVVPSMSSSDSEIVEVQHEAPRADAVSLHAKRPGKALVKYHILATTYETNKGFYVTVEVSDSNHNLERMR